MPANPNLVRRLVLAAVLGASIAQASAAGLSRDDINFLGKAMQANLAEVEVARVALEKSNDPRVKAFAAQMVQDHTLVAGGIAKLAAARGATVPKAPSAMQRAKAMVLKAVSGPSFEKSYADDAGVDAHEEALALFEKAAAKADDAEVRALAAQALPTLRHHLEMATALRKQVYGH